MDLSQNEKELLAVLENVLKPILSGEHTSGNPYGKPYIAEAMKKIAAIKGMKPENWYDAVKP